MLEENEERVLSLLEIQTSVWGIQSKPLTFAYENVMYDVIAHTCSQNYMNKKWYSDLPPGYFNYFKVNKIRVYFSMWNQGYQIDYSSLSFGLYITLAIILFNMLLSLCRML